MYGTRNSTALSMLIISTPSSHSSFSTMLKPKTLQDSHEDFDSQLETIPLSEHESQTNAREKKGDSHKHKLMRGPEAEPRDVVYVYNYSKNKTEKIKTEVLLEKLGSQEIDQTSIPYSMGSIPICTGGDESGRGETVIARVHVNMSLRVQRWLGMQKRLYIVDAIKL